MTGVHVRFYFSTRPHCIRHVSSFGCFVTPVSVHNLEIAIFNSNQAMVKRLKVVFRFSAYLAALTSDTSN